MNYELFAIGRKYAHVYSVGSCCHIFMYIYDDTIYKRCYLKALIYTIELICLMVTLFFFSRIVRD